MTNTRPRSDSSTIVDVGFIHHATYRVRGGTKTYAAWMKASTPAVIMSPAPDEAKVAFRLQYRRPSKDWKRKETEIVAYDGALYWPIHRWPRYDIWRGRSSFSPPDESITADDLIAVLDDDSPFFATRDALQNNSYSNSELRHRTVGEWFSSDRDHQSAEVQRKTTENLLIWQGRAYARGGPPIYAQRPQGQGFFDSGIGNPGHNRSLNQTADMPWDIGRNYWIQEAVATGFFQRADQYGVAKKIHSQYDADGEGGYIEVIEPSLAEITRDELQLDALVRVGLRMLSDGTIVSDALENVFKEVAALDHRLPTTSNERLAALRALVCWYQEDERYVAMKYLDRRVFDSLIEFMPRAAFTFERTELCEIDDDAVAHFGI